MKTLKLLFLISLIFLSIQPTVAQHSIQISAKFTQVQDELNNQMVFDGPALTISYGYSHFDTDRVLIFNSRFGVGILFNREILGISTNITPVDIFYGFPVGNFKDFDLFVGPKFSAGYNLQIYPDLQSGLDFWVTNLSLSPSALIEIPYNEDLIRAQVSVSILSLNSRTPDNRDPYFFSLKFGDFISDLHSDMHFGSLNKVVNTSFNAEYLFGKCRTWAIGYGFDYLHYNSEPEIKILNHSLNAKYYFGG